ncbi:YcaO-like family protein [Bradyrhizobium sp. BRP22]|uniref:YcaO-like family protein n=1 Tax=Bradyrhizobium sp. BRP22 TaxID=2793821 RepID=UPI001CD1CF90|nr:YcaO-like family protein [Bradyrhizobium sp. BRP22]MCA1458226.1 YcaO-like family protein [Bradyrhizobium sp. BRP22]
MTRIRTAAGFDRLRAILSYLYDPKVGILNSIHSIQENDREAGSPEFFRYMTVAAGTRALSGLENFSVGGGGSTSRDLALAKAIGEAIERYVAAIYDRRDHPIYTYQSAPFQCVPPTDFALYDDQQLTKLDFPYRPFTAESDVRWMPARSLVSGKSIHVAACFVYLPYLFSPDGDEWPLAQSISTGLACHDSFERAAAAGICEVIERDCFSITWQAMLSRSRIRLDSLADHQKNLIRRFTSVRYGIHMMEISQDNEVPTILTVLAAPGAPRQHRSRWRQPPTLALMSPSRSRWRSWRTPNAMSAS